MKLTKKIIEAAVKDKTGLDAELRKSDGSYYWAGKAASLFTESGTHIRTLNHKSNPLDRWVSEFNRNVQEVELSFGMGMHEIVESIDWELQS